MFSLIGVMILAYFTGAVPMAYIYCKIRGKDITKEGSGNVGATNAARLFGKPAFFTIFFLDALKGFVPVFFFASLVSGLNLSADMIRLIVFFITIVGHVWSVFIRFKGGKGVATSVGGLLALMPSACFMSMGIFALVFILTRIVSISSMAAAIILPVLVWLLGYSALYIGFTALLAFFIVFTHRSNIQRILSGTEKKLTVNKA